MTNEWLKRKENGGGKVVSENATPQRILSLKTP